MPCQWAFVFFGVLCLILKDSKNAIKHNLKTQFNCLVNYHVNRFNGDVRWMHLIAYLSPYRISTGCSQFIFGNPDFLG